MRPCTLTTHLSCRPCIPGPPPVSCSPPTARPLHTPAPTTYMCTHCTHVHTHPAPLLQHKCVHTHAHPSTPLHMYMLTHTHAQMHAHIGRHIHTQTHPKTCTPHTRAHTCMCTLTLHMHTCVYACPHSAHMYMHMYVTHTHQKLCHSSSAPRPLVWKVSSLSPSYMYFEH